jgi:hypothetical protein
MSSLPSKDPNPQSSKAGLRVRGDKLETLDGREAQIVEAGSNFFLATGEDARRVHSDLAELQMVFKQAIGKM